MSSDRGPRLAVVVLLLVVAGLVGLAIGWSEGEDAPDLGRWRALVGDVARAESVDPDLLLALVAAESGGDAQATSRAGARGLAQLMPATAAEEAVRRGRTPPTPEGLLDPETNLALGASYLKRLLDRYDGEEAFALAAYNAGMGRVDRWRARAYDLAPRAVIEREAFDETRRYVKRVLAWRASYAATSPRRQAP
ncbi:MAG: lytic transglycosylase domain-containing protein [Planctomycetota bacterium]